MKRHILGAMALILAASAAPAFAADMVEEAPAPVVAPEEPMIFSWTGGYIGVNAGYGWGKSHFTDVQGYNQTDQRWSDSPNGFVGGVQAGYNWQTGNIVLGGEAEVGYMGLKKTSAQPGYPDTFARVDDDFYGALTARLGYAMDRTMIYAKGGGAYHFGDFKIYDNCNTGACGSGLMSGKEKIGAGFVVGAGVEHAFTDNVTARIEYNYFDFGKATITGEHVNGSVGDYKADLKAHTVRLGLNYKF